MAIDSKPVIQAGVMPLVDCAPLAVVRELGLDAEFGFSLRLHREVSWANIRDKTEFGLFDCAHMLAPMPLASTLGLGRAAAPVIAPMALNLNGDAITVSEALYAEMREADAESAAAGGMAAGTALAKVAKARRRAGRPLLTLGMVYPFSCHNYDLRYWLAAAGAHPDNDARLVVIPPPLIAESLNAGEIDGFCAGAPWNDVTAAAGRGRIIATKAELWPDSPEKVLGVRRDWAEKNGELLLALMQALLKAAAWLDEPNNHGDAAAILASPRYVGVPEDVLRRSLAGLLPRGADGQGRIQEDFIVFHRRAANFPWVSHGIWMLTQMLRWGQAVAPLNLEDTARSVFRPDLYRKAAALAGVDAPPGDMKSEGAKAGHGRFFGEETFDPDQAADYAASFPIRS